MTEARLIYRIEPGKKNKKNEREWNLKTIKKQKPAIARNSV